MKNFNFLLLFLFISLFSGCKTTEDKKIEHCEIEAAENRKEDSLNLTPPTPLKQLTPVERYDKKVLRSGIDEQNLERPYVLKPGDRIEISVLDEPEMTREVFVLPDGSINYLLIGQLEAQGNTAEELSTHISEKLSKFIKNPKVSVLVKSLESPSEIKSFVSIVGAVQRPGKIEIKDGDRLLDAMTAAGGLLFVGDIWGGRTAANLNAAYISRHGKKLDVSFNKLLMEGNMRHNILVQDGDFLYFPEAAASSIIVLGEVSNPNIIPFTRDISVIEAISMCGGFTERAQKGAVMVLRTDGGETEMRKVDIGAILSGKEKVANLALKGGDIVFVPEQGLSEYERYASYLTTFVNLILQGYQLREQILFPRIRR